MLSAIALHRVAFGLGLIVAFSLGLTVVLTFIGFALVYTGKLRERLPPLRRFSESDGGGRGFVRLAIQAFPTASAAAVVAVGMMITHASARTAGRAVTGTMAKLRLAFRHANQTRFRSPCELLVHKAEAADIVPDH